MNEQNEEKRQFKYCKKCKEIFYRNEFHNDFSWKLKTYCFFGCRDKVWTEKRKKKKEKEKLEKEKLENDKLAN